MTFKKFMQANAHTFSQAVRVHPRFKFACCDCGLVHDIRLDVIMKVRRDKNATLAYRRKMKTS